MLTTVNKDYATLPTEMMDEFKEHLRILDNIEDTTISLYLASAIEAIGIFTDRDIFRTSYKYEKFEFETEQEYADYKGFWYLSKVWLDNVTVVDNQGVDKTHLYIVDRERGYISPKPINGDVVTFECGYLTAASIPPNLRSVIYRYGAHLFEDREAVRIGDPKLIPGWREYALAAFQVPRV